MVIITEAVLHSYALAGVSITDHHRVGRQFANYVTREEHCGREVPTDWSWVNPPMSASAVPTFHRLFDDPQPVPLPNFIRRNCYRGRADLAVDRAQPRASLSSRLAKVSSHLVLVQTS